jgi:flagellar protein FliO/FliZ
LIGEFGGASIKMVGSLMIILLLIIGLYYLVKKFRLSPFPVGRNQVMRLISTLNLAPKRSLALVEVGGQWLIVGIGAENLTFISRMDAPQTTDASDGFSSSGENKFHAILKKRIAGERASEDKNGKPL